MNKCLKTRVPIYEFDEHNEAFYFWQKAKYEGYLTEPLDLFHIDAHTDMAKPEVFRKSIYFPEGTQDSHLKYYQDFAKTELKIHNFILPAILSGLIKNVYFIYPKWRKLKPARKKMNIGSAFGEGKILKYGIDLKNSPHPKAVFKAFPDLKLFHYYAYGVGRIPKKRRVVLDIDLDYFACRDSVLNHLSYELQITPEQFLHKEAFLNNQTLQFSGLDFDFAENNNKYYVKISHKKGEDISYLPTKEEIESEMDTLISTLQARRIIPVIVTICRSCISGYCPDDYYEFIEQTIKAKINHLIQPKYN